MAGEEPELDDGDPGAIPLAEAGGSAIQSDGRPRMFEPPPVRLISIDGVRMVMPADTDRELVRWFYQDLLRLEEVRSDGLGMGFVAANHGLRLDVGPVPLERDTVRPVGVLTPFFEEVERALFEREYAFLKQRGLAAGVETLMLKDPAGNWVEIHPDRQVG